MIQDSIDIIQKINSSAPRLTQEDVNSWIIPGLNSYYSDKIYWLAVKAYGDVARGNTVANAAFKVLAQEELKISINTYLFKSQHWKNGRDINTYLLTAINRLAERVLLDSDNIKKYNADICPGCKFIGIKSFTNKENKLLKCEHCSLELIRLPSEVLSLKNKEIKTKEDRQNISLFESRLRIHKTFALHSKKGYRCKGCYRFLPESIVGEFGISCPFDDCDYFGKPEALKPMPHPVSMCQRSMVSLQKTLVSKNSDSKKELQDLFEGDNLNADSKIEMQETFKIEFNQLVSVIDEQMKSVQRINSSETIMQKLIMYEAYKNMLNKYPEELISYLVHRKHIVDFPIQAKIFQEYVKLMEEALPFTIIKNNEQYTICSLLDPRIKVFCGQSEFQAVVESNYTIPNKTVENYIGGINFKDYGPCFIGQLIDIIDLNNNVSIKDKVIDYTFSQIFMKDIEINTPVLVKHFRIKSHYEMGSLIYLQRIRKKIVDSVYLKLNGKKRIKVKNDKYKK